MMISIINNSKPNSKRKLLLHSGYRIQPIYKLKTFNVHIVYACDGIISNIKKPSAGKKLAPNIGSLKSN